MKWKKQMQVRSGVPIPPAQREKGKWNWLNTLEVGNSLHFKDHKEFDNVRRCLRTKGFETVTRMLPEGWVIWITEEPNSRKSA